LFYTNTNHNDASNALINYNNLTGNSESLEHPLSKYARGLFFSPNYNKEFFDAINWANNLASIELWIWSGSSLLHWTDLSHFTKSIGNAEERRDYVSIR
jgi:hypothetical protein